MKTHKELEQVETVAEEVEEEPEPTSDQEQNDIDADSRASRC